MPRVEVLSEVLGHDREVMLTEHVPSGLLANDHYAHQLVERLGWAVADAEQHEQQSTLNGNVEPPVTGSGVNLRRAFSSTGGVPE